jgi:mannose-6-phosphate isomerase-like protein (cupin superfamily)
MPFTPLGLVEMLANISPSRIAHHFPSDEPKTSSGVYIREATLRAQSTVDTHTHTYDHWGVLVSGSAAVEVNDAVVVYEGLSIIDIKAGKEHKITALTDITWLCIHATSETDPEKIDEVLIKGE